MDKTVNDEFIISRYECNYEILFIYLINLTTQHKDRQYIVQTVENVLCSHQAIVEFVSVQQRTFHAHKLSTLNEGE